MTNIAAQVQLKISPTSYQTTVAVLTDKRVQLESELQAKIADHNDPGFKAKASAYQKIEDALRDLEAPK